MRRSRSTSSTREGADTRQWTRSCTSPRSWTCDPDRCRAAGLSFEDTVFAPKPELAARMIGWFLDAGHRVDRVAGDKVYGGRPKLRSALEERGAGYVLALAHSAEVTTGAGKLRADALAAKVPKRAWQKLSAGAGAEEHRFYDRAVIDLAEHTRLPSPDGLIPLTCNEIRRLFTMLVVQPVHDVAHRLRCSAWRRRHQARAQVGHYRRQAANQA